MKHLPIIFALIAVVVIVGSLAASGSSSSSSSSPTPTSTVNSPSPSPSPSPVVETKTITEVGTIPFDKKTVDDPSLAKGKSVIKIAGVLGVKAYTYEVTLTDGKETYKKLISELVTKEPTTQITAIGTKVIATPTQKPAMPQCDPNYSGACVPIASDVDCAGGSGNGPAYIRGPVRVIGTDVYDLDRDGDGIGCDK